MNWHNILWSMPVITALRNKYLHHIYIALTHLLSTNLALNHGHHLKFGAEIPYTNMKYF